MRFHYHRVVPHDVPGGLPDLHRQLMENWRLRRTDDRVSGNNVRKRLKISLSQLKSSSNFRDRFGLAAGSREKLTHDAVKGCSQVEER